MVYFLESVTVNWSRRVDLVFHHPSCVIFIASSIIGRGLLDDALSKDVSLVAAVGQQTWLGNIKKNIAQKAGGPT